MNLRFRLPLYAKILAWFFLNAVLLAAVFAFLFTAEFNFTLDWFLASGAQARIESVRDLIAGELNTTPPDEWQQIVDRYSEAYHVRFTLFDDAANHLVGDVVDLPPAVRDRILEGPQRRRPSDSSTPAAATPANSAKPALANPAERPLERPFRGWRPPLRALMRTTDPTQYWLMSSARIDNPQTGDPMRVILVARSHSVSGGGLIFDPKPWLWLLLGAVVFSLLFWLPLVRGITRFIAQMTQATRRIAGGRFDVRVVTRRSDELGELGEAVNQMAGHLDSLVTGQKRFLGDIAHELCSPLAHLQMTLAILEQHAGPEQEKYARSAVAKAAQIAGMVNELLSFSKATFGPAAVHLEPVNVAAAIQEVVVREWGESANLRVEIPARLTVAADRELFIRAISNLLRNALRHAGADSAIVIRGQSAGKDVALSVADSGPGVPEEELGRIFDAFYRLDASRTRATGGMGLGLTIVKTCIETCCGSVSARNVEPHGLEVTVRLPAAEPEAPGEAEAPSIAEPAEPIP